MGQQTEECKMNNYTAYCIDRDGFTEEIDIQASNVKEARQKAEAVIKDEYCGGLKVKRVVKQTGAWL